MNQLGIILDGRATAVVWVKAALTYVTPLLVSNFGICRRQLNTDHGAATES
jgi:hypothetical protein